MTNQTRIKWYRSPVPKETLSELTRKSNLRPLIHITSQILFTVLTGTTAYLAWLHLPWPFFIGALFVHGSFAGFLGVYTAIHELSHRTPFKTRWVNDFFIRLCGFFSWTNPIKYRAGHERHHMVTTYTGLDLEVPLPVIIKPWHWILYCTILLCTASGQPGFFSAVYATIKNAFGVLNGEWEKMIFPESDKKNFKRMVNWARFLLIGQIIMAAAFIYFDLWPLLLIVTAGAFVAPALNVFLNQFQHLGLKPNVPDFRLCCRTILINPFLRFFYWNMNYHIEHHMYAAVPYYNLPKLHELIKDDLPVMHKGLLANWKELQPIAKQQRKDPEYYFTQEVPNPHLK